MKDALAFDQAGPVAILLAVLVLVIGTTKWLLTKLIADKDAQIVELRGTVKMLTDDIARPLDAGWTTVKSEAEERRRRR
jgi:hypothetical protein